MSLNPLNELKRRLDDDDTPLPKRLCLARNIVQSQHFPSAPKERVVANWLEGLLERNKLASSELFNILSWFNNADDFTSDLKSKLIQIVSLYVQRNPLQNEDIQHVLSFLDNSKISSQLSLQSDDYLAITVVLLQHFRNTETDSSSQCQRIFNNIMKYYKESKKKLELIIKLLQGENIETIFSFLDTECRSKVIELCQIILFPINKKTFFISYLQTLIRKDNIEELIAEKGDNIQSALKIMSVFFDFPKGRTIKSHTFLKDFIDVFVSCFKQENQLIFAFYIMVASFLNMEQSYITPAITIPSVSFEENDEKVKRQLFLNMLQVLSSNEIDITVRLTDTFGEKIPKVEIKKNFSNFLQAVMMHQLKLEGKLDNTTLQIIKATLKLDPNLIEQKFTEILPPLMVAKKNNSNISISYRETLNCLLEIMFKLSRGTIFVNQILPFVKIKLEACNTEQFELKQKVLECIQNGMECEKIKNKVISGVDIFPKECVDTYGKFTSELMFRQNKELLESLQKDFEENCLMMLEEGFVSPSIITLTEVYSAILSSFFEHNKMADHSVPVQIAQDFWSAYKHFEVDCLRKFGECVLTLSYNPPLILSFLKLSLNYSKLKLLNIKYSHFKMDTAQVETSDVNDLSILLPCLGQQQWCELTSKVQEDEAILLMDNLLLCKTMAAQLISNSDHDCNQTLAPTKSYLFQRCAENPALLNTNRYFTRVLFNSIDKTQAKHLAKTLIKIYLNNPDDDIFNNTAITNNRILLSTLVLETSKGVAKLFDNCDLSKATAKNGFDISSFAKERNMREYFDGTSLTENQEVDIKSYVGILKQIQIHDLDENCQLTAIFVLLALKKCCQLKKIKRSIDFVLQSIYELSVHPPDIHKLFPVEYIFNFEDKKLLNLLTLTVRTSNKNLIVRSILESAVKRVKSDSNLVKGIVEILLSKSNIKTFTTIESFSDTAFQTSCTILPYIVKQKKNITAAAYRSILAELQDKLQKYLLESFKNIDFTTNSSMKLSETGNIEDSMVDSEFNMAMVAYSLTLSRYCETTDVEEIKNLDCLWSGLEFFLQNAISTIQNPDSKLQHVESAIQLVNITLRHLKKLESHPVFEEKDKLFVQIWHSIKSRLVENYKDSEEKTINNSLEDIGVAIKFLCEFASVECFAKHFVGDLGYSVFMKKPSLIIKDESHADVTFHKVSRFLWSSCLKANIVGPKCAAMCKNKYQSCKNLRSWLWQHYELGQDGAASKKKRKHDASDIVIEDSVKKIKVDDEICKIMRLEMDSLVEVILAGKKIALDYKFLDSIFELQHMVHYILGCNSINIRCEVTWQSFFSLFEGSLAVLNSLLLCREEILEDRWPCYMQCYRTLISSICHKASSQQSLERHVEEKLAEAAHYIEKLTQSISKRKKQVSRIAAYAVADICSCIERNGPSRMVRQHLENSVAMLIQAADSSYAMSFLKRALAGCQGQMTMTNMYAMYKRYHKYVGNA